MTDPLDIMVRAFASALMEHGSCPMSAWIEAEQRTVVVLERMHQAGAHVGHLLRRVKIYELRCQGVDPRTIMLRMGISRASVWRDYKKEMCRRRYAA